MIHPNEPWVHSVVIKSPSIVFVPALDARLFLVCKTNTPTSRTQRIPNPFVILKENIGFAGQHVAPSNTENMQRLIEPELCASHSPKQHSTGNKTPIDRTSESFPVLAMLMASGEMLRAVPGVPPLAPPDPLPLPFLCW